jgi:flagellar FliL protein
MADAKKSTEEKIPEGAEGAEGGEAGDIKKAAKKKLFIIIGGVVFLLIAVGAGLFFGGVLGGKKDAAKQEHAEGEKPAEGEKHGEGEKTEEGAKDGEAKNKKLYLNIGEFLVNLNVSGKQASFLKMSTTLEVIGEENKKAIEENLPRIKDTLQVYLRELRAEDLKGSAGVFRLREALLLRVNKVIAPAQVSDILFEELIVQ